MSIPAHLTMLATTGSVIVLAFPWRFSRISGVHCPVPQATPFLFPNIGSLGMTSQEMAQYLQEKAKVIVQSGSTFGPPGEGHIRINFATALPMLKEALDRIEKALL